MTPSGLTTIVFSLLGAALGLYLTYLIIYLAVRNALRSHESWKAQRAQPAARPVERRDPGDFSDWISKARDDK